MNRAVVQMLVAAALLALVAVPVHAKKPPADDAGLSEAVTQEILDAIAEEMERSMAMLQIPGQPKPYFVGYKLTEVDVNDVVAHVGAVSSKRNRHFVSLEAHVHVGDYDFDNSNFVIPGAETIDGIAQIPLPIEATPRIAQRAAWLVTDAAYKEALIQLREKRNAQRTGSRSGSGVASYTREKPFVQEQPVRVPRLESLDELAARAEKISAVFRDDVHVREGRVAFTSFLERRWYLNSEGTNATDTRRVTGMLITATSQASDGQELADYYARYGSTGADLPGDAQLLEEAEKLSKNLAALREAPVMDNYSGPVLFTDQAAAQIVRYTLAPHLGGTPVPEGMPPEEAKRFGGAFAGKVGLRVLSGLLSVYDDPTSKRIGKQPVIGGFRFDDEGVPSQKVEVIQQGRLVSLLTSRTPSADAKSSNGHARRTGPGGVFHGSATNLVVQPRGGQPRRALERRLLAAARAAGLPYGLVIERIDDAAVTAAPEYAKPQLLRMFQQIDQDQPPPALIAYRLYPDGKRELVRGVQLKPVPIRAWKDLLAVGRDTTTWNFLSSGQANLEHKLNSVGEGQVPSSGIESAIVTPDLLFEDLDVVATELDRRDKPAVPPPAPPKKSDKKSEKTK